MAMLGFSALWSSCPGLPTNSSAAPPLFCTFTFSPIVSSSDPRKSMFGCRLQCKALAETEERSQAHSLLVGEYGERIVIPGEDQDGEEIGEIKLECDESGCAYIMTKTMASEEDTANRQLRCDFTGCYFVDEPPQENTLEAIQGPNWRLGFESSPESEETFSAVLGAGGWSITLTASEFNDFCQLIKTLRKGIATMNEDGFLGKESISMQAERGSLWMECIIPKKRVAILQSLWKLGSRGHDDNDALSFGLRFVISDPVNRQVQGYWPAEAVMEMLKKVDALSEEQNKSPVISS
ncbi:hypothetical protein KP509_13G079500 [Ceratopteris richardii]|uniref:Uncharacterized protein n=1 Tax=Ceratopteris richardii TaxID=49495 RepID=A0A8T2TMR9_CERRI|nr:hypothetical protein KP509_13G079500 [Ceratopteris richardii]